MYAEWPPNASQGLLAARERYERDAILTKRETRHVLVSALQHGASPRRLAAVRKWLGRRVSLRTVKRWRRWWQEAFPATPCWTAGRGRFVPAVGVKRLPLSLLERFNGDEHEQLTAALRFLSPVTTGSWARSLVGVLRR